MPRNCNCAGQCGGDGLSRREFLTIAGAGAASILGGPVMAAPQPPAPSEADVRAWIAAAGKPDKPRRYSSARHADARLHLGGIGTGNFEIGPDGRLTTWQLFNTLRDGDVPLHFGVRVGQQAVLLQTAGGPAAPRPASIEMTGEYPFATLDYKLPDVPVEVQLTAFTPLVPLDVDASSWPAAVFLFRVRNRTHTDQKVSLAGFTLNAIGYDAYGTIEGARHANFDRNVIEPLMAGEGRGLLCRAEPAARPTMDRPVAVYAGFRLDELQAPPNDRPDNLTVHPLDRLPATPPTDPAHTLVWLEDAPADLPRERLALAAAAARDGATVVLSGRTMPLVAQYAAASQGKPLGEATGRPDIVFDDFENGYQGWKVEGDAFGAGPAPGTLPAQQAVTGFEGKGLVNSFLNGDDTTGKMTSKEFTVERGFIRFLVGGGSYPTTQIRLLVDGNVVRSASGRNEERLLPASWDVREFAGKTAHIEIVDEQKGPWGHINVDQIEFSDLPTGSGTLRLLDEMLPVRFRAVTPSGAGVVFEGAQPAREGVRQQTVGGMTAHIGGYGKGRVVLLGGPILSAEEGRFYVPRRRAYGLLASLVGAQLTPTRGVPAEAPGFGTTALAALSGRVAVSAHADDLDALWQQFASGAGEPQADNAPGPTEEGRSVFGMVASDITVPAGKTVTAPFVYAWHYPNYYNGAGVAMGNHYAGRWADAGRVVDALARDLPALRARSEAFRGAAYDSTLPYWLVDCLTSQAGIMRHAGVVFRIGNGDIYGWEGSNGCCQPTCTHVWGYEQSLSRMFPSLERDMRRIDFVHQLREDGGVNNRTDVPSPPHPTGERPFADGHASCVLKAYREALNHPDEAWMREYWPRVKKAVDYLIARDAASNGGSPAGVLADDQWNTYDEALHGVTTFISGYYLAALRAGEEWATRMGEAQTAQRYHAVFERGQAKLIELCWNGEYFQQHLPGYEQMPGEVGPGCMSDQLIGQWWAHQLGLGYILPREQVVAALKSVFKYNWKPDLTGWRHMPRAFAGARDKGLIICTWPKGGRPANVMLYSDEVWTGIEYQVAAHMMYEGMVDEGLAIAKGARERYDGVARPPIPRNPWSEVECGGHYARAMSSWSMLLALSGFECDGPTGVMRFAPRVTPDNFRSLFTAPAGWGTYSQTRKGGPQTSRIALTEGTLRVTELRLAAPAKPASTAVTVGGSRPRHTASFADGLVTLRLAAPLELRGGQTLTVRLG